jgi:hypothetical protein
MTATTRRGRKIEPYLSPEPIAEPPAEPAPSLQWIGVEWYNESTRQKLSRVRVIKEEPRVSLQFATGRPAEEFRQQAAAALAAIDREAGEAAAKSGTGVALAEAERRLREVEDSLRQPKEDMAAIASGLGHFVLGNDRPAAEDKLREIKRTIGAGEREQSELVQRIAALRELLDQCRQDLRAVAYAELRERLGAERDLLHAAVASQCQEQLQRICEIEFVYIRSLEGRREQLFHRLEART